jgi:hypothetical protein
VRLEGGRKVDERLHHENHHHHHHQHRTAGPLSAAVIPAIVVSPPRSASAISKDGSGASPTPKTPTSKGKPLPRGGASSSESTPQKTKKSRISDFFGKKR